MTHVLSTGIIIFDVDQLYCQDQSHAHFDDEYLRNGDIYCKHYYYLQIASHVWVFAWHI